MGLLTTMEKLQSSYNVRVPFSPKDDDNAFESLIILVNLLDEMSVCIEKMVNICDEFNKTDKSLLPNKLCSEIDLFQETLSNYGFYDILETS